MKNITTLKIIGWVFIIAVSTLFYFANFSNTRFGYFLSSIFPDINSFILILIPVLLISGFAFLFFRKHQATNLLARNIFLVTLLLLAVSILIYRFIFSMFN